jgi:hypothetical protein
MEDSMRCSLLAGSFVAPLLLFSLACSGAAQVIETNRISGPIVHENLAVYFIRGKSAPGKVPLTLEEAMASGAVTVRETSNVNQLEIENLGDDEVFVQSGDIVKGGQQDRVLTVSLLLPPKSGRIPIASFCVEQGRWAARGKEDVKTFATASAAIPSREAKIAMKAPVTASAAPLEPLSGVPSRRSAARSYSGEDTGQRQQEVWRSVRSVQDKLSGSVGAPVYSAASQTSLQLALENEKLKDAQAAYLSALKGAGEKEDDVVGYVFAVNGKLNSADMYPSNGLFRKMWGKLLNASAIEAISHRNEAHSEAPTIEAVTAFLADAERGKAEEKPLNAGVKLDTREGDNAYYFETARAGNWVHRNYLAK